MYWFLVTISSPSRPTSPYCLAEPSGVRLLRVFPGGANRWLFLDILIFVLLRHVNELFESSNHAHAHVRCNLPQCERVRRCCAPANAVCCRCCLTSNYCLYLCVAVPIVGQLIALIACIASSFAYMNTLRCKVLRLDLCFAHRPIQLKNRCDPKVKQCGIALEDHATTTQSAPLWHPQSCYNVTMHPEPFVGGLTIGVTFGEAPVAQHHISAPTNECVSSESNCLNPRAREDDQNASGLWLRKPLQNAGLPSPLRRKTTSAAPGSAEFKFCRSQSPAAARPGPRTCCPKNSRFAHLLRLDPFPYITDPSEFTCCPPWPGPHATVARI